MSKSPLLEPGGSAYRPPSSSEADSGSLVCRLPEDFFLLECFVRAAALGGDDPLRIPSRGGVDKTSGGVGWIRVGGWVTGVASYLPILLGQLVCVGHSRPWVSLEGRAWLPAQ